VTFTRVRDLVAAAAVTAVLVNLLLQLSYGDVPTLPQLAGTTLLAFAIAEVLLGNTPSCWPRRPRWLAPSPGEPG
jgi:hypothetical protein